jgi:serine phosphatase RsbU (regulator of sigma subunit)
MNPLKKFKNYIVGDLLAKTDDVFEKARIHVLYNFIFFFLLINIPYTIQTIHLAFFHFFLSCLSTTALIAGLIIIKKTGNMRTAIFFYIFNHLLQNVSHYIINNGNLEIQGTCFILVLILFGFLMLGRRWGFAFTIFSLLMIVIGIYNRNSGFSLFHIPIEYADPIGDPNLQYMVVIPFLLLIYLVSEFVKATQKAEKQIDGQRKLLEEKNVDILSSINYAKRIQQAILPNDETIQKGIPQSFILYKPRDIVSGDFYWFNEIANNSYIMVVADCTGHGVPGAFMTVIGSNLLTQIVTENKITAPSDIMLQLDNHITATLKQEKQHHHIIQDGMDLSLLKVNRNQKEFIYTSAKRPAIFIRMGELTEFKGSKYSLGGLRSGEKTFDEIKMNYEVGDIIYLFTDGFIDQFGGNGNKKFMIKRLRELLIEIHQLPMEEQKQKLNMAITNWIGNNEQTDDIQIMGIRF